MIIDLYPTVSPNMHVQKYSRGTRPYDYNDPSLRIEGFEYTKKNCLVLDFSRNTRNLGPINDPKIPRKKGKGDGDAPIKICPWGIYNHASARYCGGKPYPSDEGCGLEFVFETKIIETSGSDEILKGEVLDIRSFNVDKVIYHLHNKIGSQPSIKVSYFAGIQRFTEYVCCQHQGYARTRAKNWWMQRHNSDLPETVEECLQFSSTLRVPTKIRVNMSGKYCEIMGVEW